MRKLKTKIFKSLHRLMAFLLSLCMTVSMLLQQGIIVTPISADDQTSTNETKGVIRHADHVTMDDYTRMLDFSENSLYAGRLWSDKSVFALNDKEGLTEEEALEAVEKRINENAGDRLGKWDGKNLTLDPLLDGTEGTITLDDDFLHVFSALGSTEQISEPVDPPIDLVLLLDMSGSMAQDIEAKNDDNHLDSDLPTRMSHSRIYAVLKSMNQMIDYLMKRNEVDRVGVIAYGGTAVTLLELGRYKTTKTYDDEVKTPMYLTVENFGEYYGSTDDFNLSPTNSGAYTVKTVDGLLKLETENNKTKETSYTKKIRNDYVSKTDDLQYIGFHTNLQAGIYKGFNELINGINKDNITYTFESSLTNSERTVQRIPLAFVMTDGGSNYALKSNTTEQATGNEWYNVPIFGEDGADLTSYDGNMKKYRAEHNIGKSDSKHPNVSFGGGEAVILDILLTASYMKSKVENKYTELIKQVEQEKNISILQGEGEGKKAKLSINTLSVDTPDGQWQIPRVYAALDPKDFFKATSNLKPVNGIDPTNWEQKADIGQAYSKFQEWVKSKTSVNIQFRDSDTDKTVQFNQLPENNEVSKQDVINNINYNDTFQDIEALDLGSAFQTLIERYTNPIFVPVDGANDLTNGLDDKSITYVDPVGKYMDIKDVKNISVFGSLFGVTETAVYSYEWNNLYQNNAGNKDKQFYRGWYKGDPTGSIDEPGSNEFVKYGGPLGTPKNPANDNWESDYNNSSNWGTDICSTNSEAWKEGWVYRLDSQTAAQFVPSLKDVDSVTDISKKQQNTEYTFYRIESENNKPLEESERRTLRMNPVYGEEVPGGVEYKDDQSHLDTDGVYALADLRIWSEDSGDYTDDNMEGSGSETDTSFDEALYINLPVNMLPLRTVSISLDNEGKFTYKTNLPSGNTIDKVNHPEQLGSVPFRVYYTVGMSDDLLTSDGSVDLAAGVSPEYINENKVTASEGWQLARNLSQNDVEFFSNWYNPERRYEAYSTTKTDYSFGDPMITFSPNDSNKYYLFQKAFPLYNAAYIWVQAEETWRKVKLSEDYTGTDVRTFSPTDFNQELRRLLVKDLEVTEANSYEDLQPNIWEALHEENIYKNTDNTEGKENPVIVKDGDIILLKNRLLTDVEKPDKDTDPDPFSSNNYYFLAIDYYNLNPGSNSATPVEHVIGRKGSEFGSAYGAAGITNGDMLVWHDVSGNYKEDYPYLSYTETLEANNPDKTRGKKFIGWKLDPETEYYSGLDKSKHEIPKTENYETNGKPEDGKAKESWKDQHDEYIKNGEWVVCAKTHGLRVGGLAEAIQGKNFSDELNVETYKSYALERFPDKAAQIENGAFKVQYYDDNITRTANNYYLPTISTASKATVNVSEEDDPDSDDPEVIDNDLEVIDNQKSKSDIIVNTYLGNNGRLIVQDTTLLLTKMVETMSGSAPANSKKFDFQVYLADKNGPVSAVRVRYNQAADSWQRQIHYIDMELDNKLFLQTNDGKRAVVDKDGYRLNPVTLEDGSVAGYQYAEARDPVTDQIVHEEGEAFPQEEPTYFVYLGEGITTQENIGSDGTALRVYHNQFCDVTGETVNPSLIQVKYQTEDENGNTAERFTPGGTVPAEFNGKRNFYAARAKLISTDQVSDEWIYDSSTNAISLNLLSLATLNPLNSEKVSDVKVESPYKTQSAYLTQTLYFGYKSEINEWLTEEGHIFPPGAEENLTLGPGDLYIPNGTAVNAAGDTEPWSHTAEVQLESGWGLLFSSMDSATDYGFAEKLNDDLLDDGYSFNRVEQKQQNSITPEGQDASTEIPGQHVYYVSGDTGDIEEEAHFFNTWSNDKSETEINGDRIPETQNPMKPGVQVDDEITYNIKWANTTGKTARIVITDPLDKGVDYISSTPRGEYFASQADANAYLRSQGLDFSVDSGHVVIWDLGEVTPDSEGSLNLTVKVNKDAEQWWDYDKDGVADAPAVSKNDYLVRDRATVRVGENRYNTNTVVNPVGKPSKTETNIDRAEGDDHITGTPDIDLNIGEDGKYHGPQVYVGDKITYKIKWRNYENRARSIKIRDPLDENVKFVSAKFKTENLDPEISDDTYKGASDAELLDPNTQTSPESPVITYDEDSRTVIWNLGEQASQQSGTVELTVEVLPSASPVGYVDNTAFVQVGNNWEQQTETIENPTPTIDKKETAINDVAQDGNGKPVKVGDTITYSLNWDYSKDTKKVINKITITDPLDPGVDFDKAEYTFRNSTYSLSKEDTDGKFTSSDKTTIDEEQVPIITIEYDKTRHLVKWTLCGEAAIPLGSVNVTVLVTNRALIGGDGNYRGLPDPLEPGGTENDIVGTSEDWDYRDQDGLESDGHVQEVQNRGAIQFNDDQTLVTDLVENPLNPKEEVIIDGTEGSDIELNGSQVSVGSTVGFDIQYQNYREEEETIIIRDPLDIGVDFIQASLSASSTPVSTEAAKEKWESLTQDQRNYLQEPRSFSDENISEIPDGIYYDGKISDNGNHTVYWVLNKVQPNSFGKVRLIVQVNNEAQKQWEYQYEQNIRDGRETEGQNDFEIYNRATVQLGKDPEIFTSTKHNPVPDKDELVDQDGVVKAPLTVEPRADGSVIEHYDVVKGQEISYNINWKNGYDQNADIIIEDQLDMDNGGVDLVSASYLLRDNPDQTIVTDDLVLTPEEDLVGSKQTDINGKPVVTISFDRAKQTVIWTIRNQKPGASGKVNLRVKVNANAVEKVDNQAVVQVENRAAQTNILENPVPDLSKEETYPGNGALVDTEENSRITYEINYQNYKDQTATIIIRDPLDPGVDFVKAGFKNGIERSATEATNNWGTLNPAQISALNGANLGDSVEFEEGIYYNSVSHTVFWVRNNVPAYNQTGSSGAVTLEVKVNDNAVNTWHYHDNPSGTDRGGSAGNGQDNYVYNRASVQVGNDPEQFTRIVENPLEEPEGDQKKEEIDPGDGKQVQVGDEITYTISWKNNEPEAATVTIEDPLDIGVDFVRASDGGTYNSATHLVTWNLGLRDPGKGGTVTLVVKVNKKAYESWQYGAGDTSTHDPDSKDYEVVNRASVQIGNSPKQYTNIPENPVPEKTETQAGNDLNPYLDPKKTDPNTSTGPLVNVGDPLQYEITWKNTNDKPAKIVITDKLDPGVDFVWAKFKDNRIGLELTDKEPSSVETEDHEFSIERKLDSDGRVVITWTLNDRPANSSGTVILNVTVNEKASSAGIVQNQAKVYVNNEDVDTNIVENPTPKSEKTETAPGDGKRVKIGDNIDYQIDWDANGESTEEEKLDIITITDAIDPGVDFVQASYGSVTLNAATDNSSVSNHSEELVDPNIPNVYTIDISYNAESRIVTWTLRGNAVETAGYVSLRVKVTARALAGSDFNSDLYNKDLPGDPSNWDYRDQGGIETEGNQLLQNRGSVNFDNKFNIVTQLVKNPTGPDKEEIKPDQGNQVTIGDKITYEITYQNYEAQNANVIVRDPLDDGVDFVEATHRANTVSADIAADNFDGLNDLEESILTGPNTSQSDVTLDDGVYYDRENRVVYWVFNDLPTLYESTVNLTVQVNENAKKTWEYGENPDGEHRGGQEGDGEDHQVLDRASVQVGNNRDIFTDIVDNPVPDKTETEVGEDKNPDLNQKEDKPNTEVGPVVLPGEKITYNIGWRNGEAQEADIVITDQLDEGVDFVSASFDEKSDKELKADTVGGTVSSDDGIFSISYDSATRTVTWTLKNQAPEENGNVILVVVANNKAQEAGYVDNQAKVQVGNKSKQTNIVENPTPEVEKEEVSPGDGERVKVGSTIDYQINWDRNDLDIEDNEDKEIRTIVITDPLDPGVDFVSASYHGVKLEAEDEDPAVSDKTVTIDGHVEPTIEISYDSESHTVIWTLRGEEATETGTVDLTVRVNSKALLGSETTQDDSELPGSQDDWGYREGDGLEDNNNQRVWNRGFVQFDNHPALVTDIVENPVGPEKEEVSPGDGKQVTVGEEINYEIEYQNIEKDKATVIVRDPLDIGVDFISARINNSQETTLAQATKKFNELSPEQQRILTGPNTEPSNVSIPTGIYYQDDERVVYWVIEDVPGIGEGTASELAASAGKVQLKVRVNSNAKQTWNYDSDDRGGNEGSGQDNQVVDRATVQVGNNPEFYTNTVDNPVPEKTETQVKGESGTTAVSPEAGNLKQGSDGNTEVGPLVQIGDEITYEISWKNGEDKDADVEISDTLDPGVDFVSASFKGLNNPFLQATDINAGARRVSTEEINNLSIRYEVNNSDQRTIIWSLGKRAAGDSGTVVLVVRVNSQASVQGEVENEATVKVGNESKKTNKVENPTPQTEKKETNPGDGEKVKVGDIIDYQIKWDRNGTQAGEDETLQTIQITDPLDPGVDFYSAGYDSLTLIAANNEAAYQNDVISAHSNVQAEDGYTIEISYNKATHTVIWIIKGAALKTEGFVDLKVKVTERALVNSTFKPDSSDGSLSGSEENWEYRDEGGIEKNSGQLAQNRALVKFNNDSDILTDLQKNPLLPVKEEVSPGEGEQVKIGDEIHYQIFWHNYKSESASVVVEDRLDAGVDFARAEFDGTILYSNNLQSTETTQTVSIPNGEQSVIKPLISYDAETHMITWNLGVQPANSDGVVDLYVKVNSKASQYWQYGQGDEPETTDPSGEGTDFEVVNRAAIQVGNDSKIYTDIIENPTPKQEKVEVNPGAGHQVMPGDQVDYEINWTNYKDEPAVVKVRDALDPGVNFKSARFGSVELTWNQNEGTTAQKPAQTLTQSGQATLSDGTRIPVTISYDPARHEIVWTLGSESTGVPARMDGKVEHSVLVNEEARKLYSYDEQGNIDSSKAEEIDKQIVNQGGITVGNDAEILTNIIPNPTEPLKDATEVNQSPSSTTTVGDVKYGPEVKVGDVITYTITWQNNVVNDAGQGEMADVTVVDTFKTPGLEFVAAGFVATTNGQDAYSTVIPQGWSVAHEGETTRWIIPKQAFGARGKVWIRARVLTEAGTHVRNGAEVIIGDEHQIVNDVVHPLSSDASLTVTKTVTGEGGDISYDWNFTVSLTQRLSGTYGDMTFTDGVASFTLKSGESKSASGLPAGVGYEVKEAQANQNGYSTSSTQAQGNIPESGTAKAAFVNHKESTGTSSTPTPGNNVSTTSDSKSANTGDNSRMSLWIALMVFSLAGLAAIGISTYRKRNRS